jgi:hypothetical protein
MSNINSEMKRSLHALFFFITFATLAVILEGCSFHPTRSGRHCAAGNDAYD